MGNLLPVLMLVVGAAGGILGTWLVIRGRIELARREATSQTTIDLATQTTLLAARDQQIAELKPFGRAFPL